jgi:hypothetical protein
VGKPGMAGVNTHQGFSLSKPWEGLRRICRGFEPDSGNLTVRDYRGASRNVRHGEIVTPSRNRKSGNGNPFTYSEARSISIPTAKRARRAETPKQAKPFPKVARAVPLSRPSSLAAALDPKPPSPTFRSLRRSKAPYAMRRAQARGAATDLPFSTFRRRLARLFSLPEIGIPAVTYAGQIDLHHGVAVLLQQILLNLATNAMDAMKDTPPD